MPQVLVSVAISIAISVALSLVSSLLFPQQRRQQQPQQPQQPSIPRSSDGKFNFKQNTPAPIISLGRTKHGSDYVLLEEKSGTAFHVMAWAGHRIQGFVQHWLHDEAVTLSTSASGSGLTGPVTSPAHFDSKVRITTRLGANAETAYGAVYSTFPTIWTTDHRGDGIASLLMECDTVAQERYTDVFPQQMPVHTAVGDGALVFDPREESHDPDDPDTWEFSTNLALLRLHQLTQPWGGKLSLSAMYLPDWAHAADVCDQIVVNRDEGEEPRYHGGLWFRADADPVEVGFKIDQAAELVIYERADGTIGVHAGEYVAPDIRVTENEITELRYDANRRAATTVLAVRARFTDPNVQYNTVDAAIWGNPYISGDDTQRTKTLSNDTVQSHNHIQRLQKIAYIRANAARVNVTVHYLATTKNVLRRRFIRAHYPSRGLDEAIVEITGRPKLNLRSLTISFEGIVVPATLYDFSPEEEGEPSATPGQITGSGVPVPTGFSVTPATEVLVNGQTAVYAIASWTHVSDALTYELEYQLSDESEPPITVMSQSGRNSVRTIHLRDGAEYQFRLRTWSNNRRSAWTDYATETMTADEVVPGQPTDFTSAIIEPDQVHLTWKNPNSPNLGYVQLYRSSSNSFGGASLIYTNYSGPGAEILYGDDNLAATTHYWWVRAFNPSGLGSAEVGPEFQDLTP